MAIAVPHHPKVRAVKRTENPIKTTFRHCYMEFFGTPSQDPHLNESKRPLMSPPINGPDQFHIQSQAGNQMMGTDGWHVKDRYASTGVTGVAHVGDHAEGRITAAAKTQSSACGSATTFVFPKSEPAK